MPYDASKPDSLPANVQKMPKPVQKQWCAVWNSSYASCTKDGGDPKECEGKAFAQANGVANKTQAAERVTFLDKLRHWLVPDELAEIEPEPTQERALDMNRLLQGLTTQLPELIRTQGMSEFATPLDVYHEGNKMFAVIADQGKLYRVDVSLGAGDEVSLSDPLEVTQQFKAVPVARSLQVYRDAQGKDRWLMIAGTAALNRVGEIDSTRLFDSFVQHAQERGMPYLTFWHQGAALRLGQADYIAREWATYLATGVFDDTPLGKAAAVGLHNQPGEWGASVGYLPLKEPEQMEIARGINVPVYVDGWNEEISVLLENRAASWFTVTVSREVAMRQEVKDALAKLVGDALAEDFAKQVDETNNQIRESGMVVREDAPKVEAPVDTATPPVVTEPPAATPVVPVEAATTTPVVPPVPESQEVVIDPQVIKELIAAMEQSPFLQTIKGTLATLTSQMATVQGQQADIRREIQEAGARLEAVERSDDEKQRAWVSELPAPRKVNVTFRAREQRAPVGADGKPAKDLAATAASTLANFKMPVRK